MPNPTAVIESLDQEGRGVAHVEGKAIFIEGALIGEHVSYSPYRKKPSYELAQATAIHRASAVRVEPRCEYFGVCGGCGIQHLEASAQVAVKQRALEDGLPQEFPARRAFLEAEPGEGREVVGRESDDDEHHEGGHARHLA